MVTRKLICCVAVAVLSNLFANAQDGERIFKRFKGDVSLGRSYPINSNFYKGSLLALEPKYAVMDKLYVGLRMEGAVVDRFIDYGGFYSHENKTIISLLGTADYYFSNNYNFRPFFGVGAGTYGIALDAVDIEFKFGAIARIGAEVKHFRIAVEYNGVPGITIDSFILDNQGNQVLTKEKLPNNYVGLKVGFCFGGGRL